MAKFLPLGKTSTNLRLVKVLPMGQICSELENLFMQVLD
jgi:hypothetical protein